MTLTLTEEQKTRLAARHKDVDAWLAILQDRVDIGRWTEEEFGRALVEQLAAADDYETTWHEMRRQRSADAVSASQLLKAMQQARIFLLSQLEEEEVAELGIAPVADAHEIIRLASRFESCIILANAQYAKTTATAEADRVRGPIEKD